MKKFLIPFLASAGFLLMAIPAYAAVPLSGYAWSSTIGWLSFNSSDGSTVQISTTTPCLTTAACITGYAWSSNIGWVKFGGLAGQQVNSTITATDATVNMSTGAVSGWARAIAGVGRTDGWDGWIELADSGANAKHSSGTGGVTFLPSTNKFTGYAWGSDVVGWLSFSNTDSNGSTTAVTVGSSTAPTCSICDPSCASYNPSDPSCTSVPTISACTNSKNGMTIIYGTQVELNATVSGGSGSYTYSWGGTGTGFTGSGNPYTYQPLAGGTYTPVVTVTDSVSGQSVTSSLGTCGSLTVNSNSPVTITSPLLWIHSSGNSSDSSCLNNFFNNPSISKYCKVLKSVGVGSSVKVDYVWPNNFSTCTSTMSSNNPNTLPGWYNGTSGISLHLDSGSVLGSTTLTALPKGVYKIGFTCNSGIISTTSNSVEIDVTPSSVQEL
jgi:hypothetical protein